MSQINKAARQKKKLHEEMVQEARNFYMNKGLISASLRPKRKISVHTSFGTKTKYI